MSDALHDGAGVIAGVHDVVWVRGPDTVRFLDGLISQDIVGMEPGDVAHSLLLAPNGKLRVPHVVWRGEDEVALVMTHGAGEIASGDLRRFKIRVDVAIDIERRVVLDVIGPRSGEVLDAAAIEVSDGWIQGDVAAGLVPFAHGGPPRYVTIGAGLEEMIEAGAEVVELAALEGLRIERGEAIVGVDVGDSTIPQEMGSVDHAVSFTKGCYLGQELVARIDSRGHVNRNLRGVVFAPDAAPVVGAELVAGDAVVGQLTSVARSELLDAPVALAMIRREVAPEDRLAVRWAGGEAAGVVRELPLV